MALDRHDIAKFQNCVALRETEKALQVESLDGDFDGALDDDGEPQDGPLWIPLACIDDDSEVLDANENAEGMLVVKSWWAEKKGLL